MYEMSVCMNKIVWSQKWFEEMRTQCQRMIQKRSGELLKVKEAFLAYKVSEGGTSMIESRFWSAGEV